MVVYGLIPKVRKLAGIAAVYEHKVRLAAGDGTNKIFQLPSVGNRQSFFVDKDASTTSTITITDVVIYDDGVSVTIDSINVDSGTVTLNVAPAANSIMRADFLHSEISDDDVILAMEVAEELTDNIIRGKNSIYNVNFEVTETITYADASPDTATRAAGSWITDGLVVGDKVVISGSTANDGTYTISVLSATVLTIASSESFPSFAVDTNDTTFGVNNIFTQVEDGDGAETIWNFEFADVTSVEVVTVDGSTLTVNTDYWIYKFEGSNTRYNLIRFNNSPSNDKQNISIALIYGEINSGVTRMAELLAAEYILLEINPARTSGMWVKGDGRNKEKGSVSRLGYIQKQLKTLKVKYDRRKRYERA